MAKKKAAKKVVKKEPAKKSAEKRVRSEEAVKVRRGPSARGYHRQQAHAPGPRRRRKFDPQVTSPVAEEETVAEAPAEAEVSDEGVGENLDATGREKPMTLGSVDG